MTRLQLNNFGIYRKDIREDRRDAMFDIEDAADDGFISPEQLGVLKQYAEYRRMAGLLDSDDGPRDVDIERAFQGQQISLAQRNGLMRILHPMPLNDPGQEVA